MVMHGILNFLKLLGSASIEVYEWDEKTIRNRLPKSPNFNTLTMQRPSLSFSGWELAHAVVKADYLDERNLVMPGIGFLLQAANVIDFSNSSFALKAGASTAINDFSLSSLAGRVGQGLALLYGQSLGLQFTAHLRTFVESLPASSLGSLTKHDAMADFLFSNVTDTVLIESKGSFTLNHNDPIVIKRKLKQALIAQIDPWIDNLTPQPAKGYVVYSCIRETSWIPSAISVVDPPGDGRSSSSIPIDPEQVMRENYSAWLRAMGLYGAAERLRRPTMGSNSGYDRSPIDTRFLIYEYDGRQIAVRAEDWPFDACCDRPDLGLDVSVLKAIATVIEKPKMTLREFNIGLPFQENREPDWPASIFPDGSFLGLTNYLTPLNLLSIKL